MMDAGDTATNGAGSGSASNGASPAAPLWLNRNSLSRRPVKAIGQLTKAKRPLSFAEISAAAAVEAATNGAGTSEQSTPTIRLLSRPQSATPTDLTPRTKTNATPSAATASNAGGIGRTPAPPRAKEKGSGDAKSKKPQPQLRTLGDLIKHDLDSDSKSAAPIASSAPAVVNATGRTQRKERTGATASANNHKSESSSVASHAAAAASTPASGGAPVVGWSHKQNHGHTTALHGTRTAGASAPPVRMGLDGDELSQRYKKGAVVVVRRKDDINSARPDRSNGELKSAEPPAPVARKKKKPTKIKKSIVHERNERFVAQILNSLICRVAGVPPPAPTPASGRVKKPAPSAPAAPAAPAEAVAVPASGGIVADGVMSEYALAVEEQKRAEKAEKKRLKNQAKRSAERERIRSELELAESKRVKSAWDVPIQTKLLSASALPPAATGTAATAATAAAAVTATPTSTDSARVVGTLLVNSLMERSAATTATAAAAVDAADSELRSQLIDHKSSSAQRPAVPSATRKSKSAIARPSPSNGARDAALHTLFPQALTPALHAVGNPPTLVPALASSAPLHSVPSKSPLSPLAVIVSPPRASAPAAAVASASLAPADAKRDMRDHKHSSPAPSGGAPAAAAAPVAVEFSGYSPFRQYTEMHTSPHLYREYCNQMPNPSLDSCVIDLLAQLIRFQDRMKERDPMNAKLRKRYVCGLKEVRKLIKADRIKCVIIAPNVEPNRAAGGLDSLLAEILQLCASKHVFVVFALSRKRLSRVFTSKTSAKTSTVGILDPTGCDDIYKKIVTHTIASRELWAMFQHDTFLNPYAVAQPQPSASNALRAGGTTAAAAASVATRKPSNAAESKSVRSTVLSSSIPASPMTQSAGVATLTPLTLSALAGASSAGTGPKSVSSDVSCSSSSPSAFPSLMAAPGSTHADVTPSHNSNQRKGQLKLHPKQQRQQQLQQQQQQFQFQQQQQQLQQHQNRQTALSIPAVLIPPPSQAPTQPVSSSAASVPFSPAPSSDSGPSQSSASTSATPATPATPVTPVTPASDVASTRYQSQSRRHNAQAYSHHPSQQPTQQMAFVAVPYEYGASGAYYAYQPYAYAYYAPAPNQNPNAQSPYFGAPQSQTPVAVAPVAVPVAVPVVVAGAQPAVASSQELTRSGTNTSSSSVSSSSSSSQPTPPARTPHKLSAAATSFESRNRLPNPKG